MIPTPAQPDRRYGIGAVNYHTGETVVHFQRRKRRKEVAQLLEAACATLSDPSGREQIPSEIRERLRAAARGIASRLSGEG